MFTAQVQTLTCGEMGETSTRTLLDPFQVKVENKKEVCEGVREGTWKKKVKEGKGSGTWLSNAP